MPRRNDEALLERLVLLALGGRPDVFIARNEVGSGLTGSIVKQLCSTCRPMSNRYRITYGLGVGSPDLLVSVSGHLGFMELKSAAGQLRPEQVLWHAAAEARGIRVATVRTVLDAEEFVRKLGSGLDEDDPYAEKY